MYDRRDFLKGIAGTTAGLATIGTASARPGKSEKGRFIVDTGSFASRRNERRARGKGLGVVSRLQKAGVMVVEGTEEQVASLGGTYVPDFQFPKPDPRVVEMDAETLDRLEPLLARQTGTERFAPLQWDKAQQNLDAVHEYSRGAGTRIAVIDSGVDPTHRDLNVNVPLSRNFTADGLDLPGAWDGGHGTNVAGIAAAKGVGTLGTAPDAEVVDLRVFSPSDPNSGSFSYVLEAMYYAGEIGCDVANMSLGLLATSADPYYWAVLAYVPVIESVAAAVTAMGTVVVASAGNESTDLDGAAVHVPSAAPSIISVSAFGPVGYGWPIDDVNGNGQFDVIRQGKGLAYELEDPIALASPYETLAVYSNYGETEVDIGAFGGNASLPDAAAETPGWYLDLVYNTYSSPMPMGDGRGMESGYAWLAGTSMSAPQVAGAAALVKSLAPGMSATDVRAILEGSASDLGQPDAHGSGILNPLAAVQSV